jgi:hypothetical protein
VTRARDRLVGVVALVAAGACAGDDGDGSCGGEACTVADDRAALIAEVAGFDDPVAAWIRAAARDDGSVADDWREALDGIAGALGCDGGRERAFVVLSNAALRPKAVVTQCSDDPIAASRALAVFEPNGAGDDLDADRFRLAGFDAASGAYRRYQMVPHEGALKVAVEPGFCGGCHGGPYGLDAWVPIMNEMTNPWAQWNAAPGFSSFEFDQHLAAGAIGPVYDEIVEERLDSASELEPIVRAGIDRVVAGRIAARDDEPSLDAALALLRPVFCDDSVNFVSEVHDAGEIHMNALVDPGIARMFVALAAEQGEAWPWSWLYDDRAAIPAPDAGDEPLAMVAVRGEISVQAEAALVSRGVLAPLDVLRVRALDWTHPVGSTLRCELLTAASARAIDVGAYTDNGALVRAVFERALAIETEAGLVSLVPPHPGQVVAIADAADPAWAEALAAGDVDAFAVDPAVLGESIQIHVSAHAQADARALLQAERVRRGCLARATYPTAPIVPGTDDCD